MFFYSFIFLGEVANGCLYYVMSRYETRRSAHQDLENPEHFSIHNRSLARRNPKFTVGDSCALPANQQLTHQ